MFISHLPLFYSELLLQLWWREKNYLWQNSWKDWGLRFKEFQEANYKNMGYVPPSKCSRSLFKNKKVKLLVLLHGASSQLRRNPPKHILLRWPVRRTYLHWNASCRQASFLAYESFGGYPSRIHPRPSGRGILRRRVKSWLTLRPHVDSAFQSRTACRRQESALRVDLRINLALGWCTFLEIWDPLNL